MGLSLRAVPKRSHPSLSSATTQLHRPQVGFNLQNKCAKIFGALIFTSGPHPCYALSPRALLVASPLSWVSHLGKFWGSKSIFPLRKELLPVSFNKALKYKLPRKKISPSVMRIGLKQYIAPGSEILHAFLSPHMVEGKLQALSPGVMRWHKFISKKEVSNPHICWETKQKQKNWSGSELKSIVTQKIAFKVVILKLVIYKEVNRT